MMRRLLTGAVLVTLMFCRRLETVTGAYYLDYHGPTFTICDEWRSVWSIRDTAILSAYQALALPQNEQVLLRVEGVRQDTIELRNMAGSGATPEFYVRRVLEMRLRAPNECRTIFDTIGLQLKR